MADPVTFKLATVEEILKTVFKEKTTRLSPEAVKMSAEFFRLFALEAIHRAAQVARSEGEPSIEPSHLERILPQLLLDF